MRILFSLHNMAYKGGGTFYRALNLGQSLSRLGHQVDILTSTSGETRQFSIQEFAQKNLAGKVRLVFCPGIFPTRWRYGYDFYENFRRLQWVLAEHKKGPYDIAHAFSCRPTAIYPALAIQKAGAILIVEWADLFGKGGSVEQRKNPFVRAVLRPLETYYETAFRDKAHAQIILNLPDSTLGKRAQALAAPGAPVFYLSDGADPDRIYPLDRDECREILNISARIPLLGYVGALFQDDAQLLMDSFERLRRLIPNVEIVLIGNPKVSLPEIQGLRRTGFVDDAQLNSWLGACDVLMLPLVDSPANRGRFPSKIWDYMSAGKPIIACDVGDVKIVLDKIGAAVICPPHADALAVAAEKIFNDPNLAFRLGKAGRRAIEVQYNWNMLGLRLEKFYKSILEQ